MFLNQAPFNLDPAALAWVQETFASLSLDERIAQVFVLLSRGGGDDELATLKHLQPGGITRFFTGTGVSEKTFIATYAQGSKVPPLVSADLEGSRMSLPFGTEVPNPLALAAVDDPQASRSIARIMAEAEAAIDRVSGLRERAKSPA